MRQLVLEMVTKNSEIEQKSTSFFRVTWFLVLQLTKHKSRPLFGADLPLSAHMATIRRAEWLMSFCNRW